MAERKTKYTNADLKVQGGPATEYGPWTTKLDADYDQAIGGGDIDTILADARRVANRRSVVDDASGKPTRAEEIRRLGQRASTPTQTEQELRRQSTLGGIARDTFDAAMLPAAFTGVGAPIAAAYYGVRGLEDFVADPSVMSGSIAALGAVPYAGKAAGKLLPKAAKAMTQAEWARKLRPSQVAAKADQWTPPRPPSAGPGAKTTGTGWEPAPWPGIPKPTSAAAPKPSGRPELNMEGLPGPPANFTPQPYNDPRRQNVRSVIDSLVAGDTPAPRRTGASMASLMDDVPELQLRDEVPEVFSSVDEATGYAGRNRPQASEPEDLTDILDSIAGKRTRYPMGATGDEYAGIRETGGAFKQPNLTPEEAALIEEFWTDIALGRR